MIAGLANPLFERVNCALQAGPLPVRRTGPASWTLAGDDATSSVEVEAAGDWVAMRSGAHCPLFAPEINPAQREDRVRSLLAGNAALPGPVKLALDPLCNITARAEIPARALTDEDGAPLVGEILAGFGQARALLGGATVAASETAETDDGAALTEFEQICEEAGIATRASSEGPLVLRQSEDGEEIDLVAGTVLERWQSGCRLWVEAAPDIDFDTPASRVAAAVLLLSVGGLIRLARPSIPSAAGEFCPRFEAVPGRETPTPDALLQAAAALSAAVRLCRLELAELRSEQAAALYLSIKGIGSENPRRPTHPNPKTKKQHTP